VAVTMPRPLVLDAAILNPTFRNAGLRGRGVCHISKTSISRGEFRGALLRRATRALSAYPDGTVEETER
jgi:hypothetical protein